MKITVSNLTEQYPKLNIQLPKQLNQEEFEFVKENLDLYKEDDTIKKYIDTFVLKLNEFASKKKSKGNPKPGAEGKTTTKPDKPEQKLKRSNKKVAAKKTKPKKEAQVVQVEHYTLEEKFIKRYLLLHGKSKTKNQILNFLKALQKSIVEKQIKRTSKHAGIIEHIQKQLLKLYNTMSNEVLVRLDEKSIEKYKSIIGTKKVRLSITYIKRFIGLYGKETKEKAGRLLGLVIKALSTGKIPKNDPYLKQLKAVQKALENYLDNNELSINETQLRGLAGIAGCPVPKTSPVNSFESSEVISSLDLQKAVFRHMGFTGIWKKIIGDPEEPFHVMIYGPGGKGKSTFGIKFATYLSKELQRKVLYVADEEKISNKLKDKLQLFNAYNQNLAVTGKFPNSIKSYEIVFLDSVTSMGMEPEELEEIQEKHPNVSFIYILQTNKQGSFYGKKKWEHLCDVVLRFEDGVVNVEKNRFGKVGEYRIRK